MGARGDSSLDQKGTGRLVNTELPPTIRRLWELAGGNPWSPASDWNAAFDPVGLLLLAPPRNFGYWCTPINSVTFAATGGDGVHFGLLSTDGALSEASPVVMTVPMCDTPNAIVGAGLHEFLALGCRLGYFSLEQLIHQPERALAELEDGKASPEQSKGERKLLARLISEFDLDPWPNPRVRFAELQLQYMPTLRLPEPHEGAT